LKIGILLWDLSVQGGCQRQAAELARKLKDSGDTVSVYAAYHVDEVYPDILEGIPVRSLYRKHNPVRISGARFLGLPVSSVRLTVREFLSSRKITDLLDDDIDVLNVHEMFVIIPAAKWKERTGKPVLWMMNEFPGALAGSSFFRSGVLNKIFDHVNGIRCVGKWYEGAIRRFDRIVVLDDRISRKSLVEKLGIDPVTIRSGLDLQKFSYRSREPSRGDHPVGILSNAILFPHRRLEDIVDALGVLHREGVNFVWRHIGLTHRHPEYATLIRNKIEREGIADRTIFLGTVSDEELVRLYQDSDIFLFSSHPQTWGLVVFEAMACGTPVVVSRGAGASEVLTDGVNALLVDSRNPLQIAAAIRRLVNSPKDWERLSRAGRSFVESNITWEIYAKKIREEMVSICARYPTAGPRA
jgi:glycosyltransferase involved in cell wall biosynthesis